MSLRLSTFLALSLPCVAFAQNDSAGNDTGPDKSSSSAESVWRFGSSEAPGEWIGKPKLNEPGPRAPTYPKFAADNKAARFAGDGTKLALEVKDSDELRFGLNETITIEAWVKVADLKDGAAPYIVGKGRLGKEHQGLHRWSRDRWRMGHGRRD